MCGVLNCVPGFRRQDIHRPLLFLYITFLASLHELSCTESVAQPLRFSLIEFGGNLEVIPLEDNLVLIVMYESIDQSDDRGARRVFSLVIPLPVEPTSDAALNPFVNRVDAEDILSKEFIC